MCIQNLKCTGADYEPYLNSTLLSRTGECVDAKYITFKRELKKKRNRMFRLVSVKKTTNNLKVKDQHWNRCLQLSHSQTDSDVYLYSRMQE